MHCFSLFIVYFEYKNRKLGWCMPLISLNVGGKLFCTTISTLNSEQSMLSSLINNANPAQMLDGALFIDRDFTVFHFILNFLRGSSILPEKKSTEFRLLEEEANYYCLDRLYRKLHHMKKPFFKKYDLVVARGTKCTIQEVDDNGYLASKNKQTFRINSDEEISTATIEPNDNIIFYQHSIWTEASCVRLISRDLIRLQLHNGDELQIHLNSVRF